MKKMPILYLIKYIIPENLINQVFYSNNYDII
jgi:hypothetical protein